jgi:hypothetical protein
MGDFLIPSSVVQQPGIYRISHPNGHTPDGETFIWQGMVLPSCPHEGCHVTYTFMRPANHISEDPDFKIKAA